MHNNKDLYQESTKELMVSSYSSNEIANLFEYIHNSNALHKLLKNLNILLEDGNMNPLLKGYRLTVNQVSCKETEIWWTEAGKKYITKALNAYTSIVEPLLIVKTKVQELQHTSHYTHYFLEVVDQYGRYWNYSTANFIPTLDDIKKIEIEELEKTILDINLYNLSPLEEHQKIKRHENIEYVYTSAIRSVNYSGYVLVVAKNGLVYQHSKIFNNYESIKKFALKIKEIGTINLEFWECLGEYHWENNEHENLEEDYKYSSWDIEEYKEYEIGSHEADNGDGQVYLGDGVYINAKDAWF